MIHTTTITASSTDYNGIIWAITFRSTFHYETFNITRHLVHCKSFYSLLWRIYDFHLCLLCFWGWPYEFGECGGEAFGAAGHHAVQNNRMLWNVYPDAAHQQQTRVVLPCSLGEWGVQALRLGHIHCHYRPEITNTKYWWIWVICWSFRR